MHRNAASTAQTLSADGTGQFSGLIEATISPTARMNKCTGFMAGRCMLPQSCPEAGTC